MVFKNFKILIFLSLLYLITRILFLLLSFGIIQHPLELYYGAVAKELIKGPNLPIFDYAFNEAIPSSAIVGMLVVPLFLLFGESFFVLKLLNLFFSLLIIVLNYLFLYKFFNKRIAIISTLLFTFSPISLTQISFMMGTPSYMSLLFSVITMYLFYRIIFDNKIDKVYFSLLGLISGFALFFIYYFIFTLSTFIIVWFIREKRFFIKKEFFIFLISFIVGFSPWIYYNFSRNFIGAYIHHKPIYAFILNSNSVDLLVRLKSFFIYKLPISLGFRDIGTIRGIFLDYIYYLIFIGLFCFLLCVEWKGILNQLLSLIRIKRSSPSPEKMPKAFPFIVYLVSFSVFYNLSGFYLNEGYYNSRFVAYSFLFLFIIIAIGWDKLWSLRKRYSSFLCALILVILVFIGFIENLNLALSNRAAFAEGLVTEGYEYGFFGFRLAGSRFGADIKKCINIINRVERKDRNLCYTGFAMGSVYGRGAIQIESKMDIPLGFKIAQGVDKEYRFSIYEGIGWGIGELFTPYPKEEELISKFSNLIASIDKKYWPYLFRGLGFNISKCLLGAGSGSMERLIDYGNQVNVAYRSYFYTGLGFQAAWDTQYEISKCIDRIEQIDKDWRRYCYQGLGWGIGLKTNLMNIDNYIKKIEHINGQSKYYCYQGFGSGISLRYGYNFKECIDFANRIEQEYKPYFYRGLGWGVGVQYGYDINKCKEITKQIAEKYSLYFCEGLKESVDSTLGNDGLLQL